MRTARTVAAAALAIAVSGCGSTIAGPPASSAVSGRTRPPAGDIVAALAPLPGGGLRYGTLRGGVVRDRGSSRVLARVPVRSGGQRGLLGLAVDSGARTFAASVARDGHLVVDQILPAPRRRVWTGPVAAGLGNGGHLAVLPSGRLVIGVGDLQRPSRTRDPRALNGKLLELDADGPASQTPRILSGGWNNPFAFAATAAGSIWVADNAPGRRPERLGPGFGPGPRTALRRHLAPSGLAVLTRHEVAVCGVASGTLERYRRASDGRWSHARTFASPCRYGVAQLAGGDLVVSTDSGLRRVRR